MKGRSKIKLMFLNLAKVAKKEKDYVKGKFQILHELELELTIAERILDGLSEARSVSVDILVRINRHIYGLRQRIEKIKQKKQLKDLLP